MKFPWSVLCLPLLAASCGDFPRDPEGTLARVRDQGSFRVGVVTRAGRGAAGAEVAALLAGIENSAGAKAELIGGDAEPMLDQLEQGELDLVIGRFEKKSPWAKRVTIGPPLRREKQGKAEFHLAPVLRNGENAWIALVEREVRNAAPEAQ
jgi:hypothetical protein